MDLSSEEQETLLKIYIGQNIRKEGMLQSEIDNQQHIQTLLSRSFIKENHWHLHQFLTTEIGSNLGNEIILNKINEETEEIQKEFKNIPQKARAFTHLILIMLNLVDYEHRCI